MADPQDNPLRIIQITDTHLYGVTAGTLLKMNTSESLARVIDLILENESEGIDLILATGDIAQDASVEAYHKFIEMIEPLKAPCRWIPGNHDHVDIMASVADGTPLGDKQLSLGNWKFIFLNTAVIGQVHGKLAEAELAHAERSLSSADSDDSTSHALICMHHNPVQASAAWMKDIGLRNNEEFWNIAAASETLRCVVYGHVHQELDYEHQGIRCLCTPSTCIQFKPEVTNFALDEINPGYRRILLHPDGRIDTEVFRLGGRTLDADFNSSGY